MLATPPRKSFGEKIARSIEIALELPAGYLDDANNCYTHDDRSDGSQAQTRELPPKVSLVSAPRHRLTADERIILDAYRIADDRLRRIMLASAREVIESFSHRTEIEQIP